MFISVAVHGGSPSEYLKSLPQLRPFAARTKLIYLALIKKKKRKQATKVTTKRRRDREKERDMVFSNVSFIPPLSTSRVFFCFATRYPILLICGARPPSLHLSSNLHSSVSRFHTRHLFSTSHSITLGRRLQRTNHTFLLRSCSHANSLASCPRLSSYLSWQFHPDELIART